MDVTPKAARLAPLRHFIATENASAIVLLAATLVALLWANSPWSASYEDLWTTELSLRVGDSDLTLDVRHWINDGLMAFFFFVVGLEIRREFDVGEMRERRRIATPVLAAIGGMVLPALIYLAYNIGEPSVRGWGIVMGTDTAFALGVLTLIGGAAPRARTFLLTVVIVDDVVALLVIALVYTQALSVPALLVALLLFVVIEAMRRAGIAHGGAYLFVGTGLWLATLASGIHATIAGVVIGILAAAYPPRKDELERAGAIWRLFREEPTPDYARLVSKTMSRSVSPNERLQHLFHPITSFVIVPLFALANAGVELSGDAVQRALTSPITLGILAGLVVGKIVGITGAAWLASRPAFGGLPLTVPWTNMVTVATVAGIGFTVSLLIADISFEGSRLEEAKLGILAASALASLLAWLALRLIRKLPAERRAAGAEAVAPEIVDLSEDVDPTVDHFRGPADAPITIVEYGDFECPYCGQITPLLGDLEDDFGDEVALVFRHLPLEDVHEHARLAAEASEAAGAQGRFWEMHDALMSAQDRLEETDLVAHARVIGLDIERFVADLEERRHAGRVDRDVSSADESGAAGTPTLFINGRRYAGRHDRASIEAAVRAARRPLAKT